LLGDWRYAPPSHVLRFLVLGNEKDSASKQVSIEGILRERKSLKSKGYSIAINSHSGVCKCCIDLLV